jgi:hypothetical protein
MKNINSARITPGTAAMKNGACQLPRKTPDHRTNAEECQRQPTHKDGHGPRTLVRRKQVADQRLAAGA